MMWGKTPPLGSAMRLDAVTIGAWKNLRDFSIDFEEESPYTVLVGENGAGKSNLIEALTLIFRNLDLDLPAPFAYELKYRCRGHNIRVSAEADRVQHSRFSTQNRTLTERFPNGGSWEWTRLASRCSGRLLSSVTTRAPAIDWRASTRSIANGTID